MADTRKSGKVAGKSPRLAQLKKPAAQRTPAAASHEVALDGPSQWSAATGTPVADMRAAAEVIRRATGERPNRLVLRADALEALRHNTEVRNYAAGVEPGPAGLQLLQVVLNVAEIEVNDKGGNTALLTCTPRQLQAGGSATALHSFKFTNVVAEHTGAQATARKPRQQAAAAPHARCNAPDGLEESGLQLKAVVQPVKMRTYSAIEWLRLLPAVEPMVSAMAAVIAAGREPSYEEALTCMVAQGDLTSLLVADAADLTAATVRALCPNDCELLLMTWWGANGRYLVRRAMNRVDVRRAELRPAEAA
ncbi:MAG TPA: hypothetical protein PK306_05630 [Aquabacterium sp.]|nr:hypothetical protein [Aquabacterium sp.]